MDAPSTLPPAESASVEPSSLFERLTNIITSPGDAYEEIKDTPVNHSNWLVPLLLVCVAGIFYVSMAFSQAGVLRGIEESREAAMQKQIAAHKITQAQADQADAMAAKFMTPTLLKIFGGGGASLASVGCLFYMAFGLWLGLKLFAETPVGYLKLTEVCGLALVIDVIQKIIRAWLVCWKENLLVTVSPTLFLQNADVHSKRDVLLSLIDPIDIWWLAVISLGVSKVARISYATAAAITFTVWFGLRILAALLTPAQ
jgi:hypothetical protein